MGLFTKADKHTVSAHSEDSLSCYVDSLLDNYLDTEPPIDPLISESSQDSKATAYGIEQAIALMRRIPLANQDVVLVVLRETLYSANIDVEQIVVDAEHKSTDMVQRIFELTQHIDRLQTEIREKEQQIQAAEADLAETSSVRRLLEISLQSKALQKNPLLPSLPLWPSEDNETPVLAPVAESSLLSDLDAIQQQKTLPKAIFA